MAPTKSSMFIHTQRLASFKPQRRRSSFASSKSAHLLKWPHPELTPKSLADSGFYFAPSEDSPDNVTCYLCEKSLDGWEPGDDPLAEHLRHSKDCGWAVTATTMAEEQDFTYEPHGKIMNQARLKTFGTDIWPHNESKNLSISKMVDAGFHFEPRKDSPDYAFCPYCHVSLAAWDPDDDPWDEHQTRAPDCHYIVLKPLKKKAKRSSRVSSQPTSKLKPTKRASRKKHVYEPSIDNNVAQLDQCSGASMSRKPEEEDLVISNDPTKNMDVMLKRKARKRTSSIARKIQDENNPIAHPPKRRQTRSSVAPKTQLVSGSLYIHSSSGQHIPISKYKKEVKSSAESCEYPATFTKKPRLDDPDHIDTDQILSLDANLPLLDKFEDEVYKMPFIRQTKRTTRSRASMLIDAQIKTTTECVPGSSATKQKVSTPSSGMDDSDIFNSETPMGKFFKDKSQDFSLPIKVPEHLARSIVTNTRTEELAEEQLDLSLEHQSNKTDRGCTKKPPIENSVTETKTKRGRPAKKKGHVSKGQSSARLASMPECNPHAGMEISRTELIGIQEPEVQPNTVIMNIDGSRVSTASCSATNNDELRDSLLPIHTNYLDASTKPNHENNIANGSLGQHVLKCLSSPKNLDCGSVQIDHVEESNHTHENIPTNKSPNLKKSESLGPSVISITGFQSGDDSENLDYSPCKDDETNIYTIDRPLHRFDNLSDVGNHISSGSESIVEEQCPLIKGKIVKVPLVSTPPTKQDHTLRTTKPWSPVNLDKVSLPPNRTTTPNEPGLSDLEREMTVEEWVLWNAVCAETRLAEAAEKFVTNFEEKGTKGIAAIEGVMTV